MNYSTELRRRLTQNAKIFAKNNGFSGKEEKSAFIFKDITMNFNESSYANIIKNPKWKARLEKTHSHYQDKTREMQSSNSSDALLMNIFCHPKFINWKGPANLLRIDVAEEFVFGWNPTFDNEKAHKTEIDLKIGNRIFESKLTEESFSEKERSHVVKYPHFNDIFSEELLLAADGQINHYQLIRNIITAYKYDFSFTILLDESRIDLIYEIFTVIKSVKIETVRNRINFVTWQEIIKCCGTELSGYIKEKYFSSI